jgi:hypothetical protein
MLESNATLRTLCVRLPTFTLPYLRGNTHILHLLLLYHSRCVTRPSRGSLLHFCLIVFCSQHPVRLRLLSLQPLSNVASAFLQRRQDPPNVASAFLQRRQDSQEHRENEGVLDTWTELILGGRRNNERIHDPLLLAVNISTIYIAVNEPSSKALEVIAFSWSLFEALILGKSLSSSSYFSGDIVPAA